MNACANCGCSPCACSPSVINNPQIIGGIFDGPTINGATINGGTSNQQEIVGALIDCTTRGCTMPAGICDESLATTAFTCTAIENAISGSNPAFCQAIADCLASDPSALCPTVATCINTTPGIINTTQAFGFNSRATTALFGVVRYATTLELNQGSCLVAIDPCTLIAAWNTPPLGTPFWNSFVSAVNSAIGGSLCTAIDACLATSAALCTAVDACGFARLASPVFTGNPRAPTPPPGDNSVSIATTAFVQAAFAAQISSLNATFCAAVAACVGGGGVTGGNFAAVRIRGSTSDGLTIDNITLVQPLYGCTASINVAPGTINVAFTAPQSDVNYGIIARIVADVNGGLVTNMPAVALTIFASTFGVNSLTFQVASAPGGVFDIIAIFTR